MRVRLIALCSVVFTREREREWCEPMILREKWVSLSPLAIDVFRIVSEHIRVIFTRRVQSPFFSVQHFWKWQLHPLLIAKKTLIVSFKSQKQKKNVFLLQSSLPFRSIFFEIILWWNIIVCDGKMFLWIGKKQKGKTIAKEKKKKEKKTFRYLPFSVLIFIVFAFDPVLFSMCFHFTEESLLFYVVLYTRPISLPQVVIIVCVRFGTADAESLMHTPMRLGFFFFYLVPPPPCCT